MNACERTLATLRGEPRDRVSCQPIIMTFAARLAGVSYRGYVTDYCVLADSQLRVAEEFGIETVSCCSDAWREASDCGAQLVFYDDGPPACKHHLLEDKALLPRLTMPSPETGPRMADRVNAVGYFAERVKGELPILGWVEGPVAEAADLRGINELMVDTIDDLPFVLDLFEWVTEMEIAFARAQIAAGADIIGIGDAAASLVSPGFYADHVVPYERRIIDAVHDAGAIVRLHICGNTDHLLEHFGGLGADLVELDHLVGFAKARECIGDGPVLMGNADPVTVVRNGKPRDVTEACAACHAAAGQRYILSAGCEIPPDTPHENLRAMVAYAHQARYS